MEHDMMITEGTEEFAWLSDEDENIDYISEALIEENGHKEAGIAIMINSPCEIVFTISDLRKIINLLKEDE